jgi:glycosidase
MPGIPIVYYGSEWGEPGEKCNGDPSLRPYIEKPEWNGLTDLVARLARIFRSQSALQYGSFRSVALTNQACAYAREYNGEKILVCINESNQEQTLHFQEGTEGTNLLTNETFTISGGITLPPYMGYILKIN